MKKWILLLTLLVLSAGWLGAQSTDNSKKTLKELKFYIDIQPALETAKAQDKPVFVYAWSASCYWCKKFEEETLANQSVIQALNENFILYSIDVDNQKTEIRNFRIFSTPTEIFLDPSGKEIKRIPGYTDAETFLSTINEIANKKRQEQ